VTAGLILAAGAGTRFGEQPKLLATVKGRSLLEHAIRAQRGVPELGRIVVVLGAHAAGILAAIDFGEAEPVICEHWRDGLAASLRCGVNALSDAGKLIVTLGDQPLITSRVIARFLDEPGGTRATYNGRPGHPVLLGVEQIRAVRALTGDQGARALLANGPTIECAGLCSGRDVDTPADLEEIRNEASAIL
jgi:CTP:molybdopterin cytidylyltransferase MocA